MAAPSPRCACRPYRPGRARAGARCRRSRRPPGARATPAAAPRPPDRGPARRGRTRSPFKATPHLWTTRDVEGVVSAALDVMGAVWQLPGYQVVELVGFGGSGEVWRARVEATGEVVALKRLHSADAGARERLRRGAGLLSSGAGQHGGRVCGGGVARTHAGPVRDQA